MFDGVTFEWALVGVGLALVAGGIACDLLARVLRQPATAKMASVAGSYASLATWVGGLVSMLGTAVSLHRETGADSIWSWFGQVFWLLVAMVILLMVLFWAVIALRTGPDPEPGAESPPAKT